MFNLIQMQTSFAIISSNKKKCSYLNTKKKNEWKKLDMDIINKILKEKGLKQ